MRDADELRQRLEAFLTGAAGGEARVTAARPLAGGASRETWAIDVEIVSGPEAGRHQLALRCDLGGTIHDESLSREQEFAVLRAVHGDGVQAPRPRWGCWDASVIERPFFLMDRLPGEALGRRIVKDPSLAGARAALPGQLGAQLARIHAVDFARQRLDFLPSPAVGADPAQVALGGAERVLRRPGEPHPALELALRWLERNAPRRGRLVLAHGDFRIGNVLVGPEGLLGILDWEFAHVGDPHEDLAWPLVRAWRFGRDELRFGGVADVEPFFEAYESGSGNRVDREAIAYWEILGNLRWAVACLSQADRHLSGLERSVELASLGRKAAEVEWELLELLCTIDRRPPS